MVAAAVPALIAAGGALLGGMMGNSAQRKANQLNRRLQFEQQQWEEKMSNTAYQRATMDMKLAGINPMLAVSQGGASTPSVSAATVQPEDAMARGIASAADKAAQVFSLQKMQAEARYTKEKADQEEILTDDMKAKYLDPTNPNNYTNMHIEKMANELGVSRETLKQAQIQTRMRVNDERLKQIETEVAEAIKGYQVASARDQSLILEKEVGLTDAKAILARLQIPESKAIAEWFNTVGSASPATKAIMSIGQWLKFILQGR